MKFLNRHKEQKLLNEALTRKKASLIVVYGRRRCGKSTLIKKVLSPNDIYFTALLTDVSLQRQALADTIASVIKDFNQVLYPTWESLFNNLNQSCRQQITLCLDEFPYLLKQSPELPSLLQKFVDQNQERMFHIILCGSAQQMMQGLVLDSTNPLYGRSNLVLKIEPLNPGWLPEALGITYTEAIAEYSVWGGVPRYWELRSEKTTFTKAVIDLVLDKMGILHDEPLRLFLDDMRESVQVFSILSVVGMGANRLSEIAARLQKPASQITRPVETLIKLGYLKRDIPFGENIKNSKRSLYRIADPYLSFYFRFVVPNQSRLNLGLAEQVYNQMAIQFNHHVASIWEQLCRESVPYKPINNIQFDMASRWWSGEMEFDVVAKSLDGKTLLIGECKWSKIDNPENICNNIVEKAKQFGLAKSYHVMPIVFAKEIKSSINSTHVLLPKDILERIK